VEATTPSAGDERVRNWARRETCTLVNAVIRSGGAVPAVLDALAFRCLLTLIAGGVYSAMWSSGGRRGGVLRLVPTRRGSFASALSQAEPVASVQ
jgi:hypothetical protein